MSHLGLKPEAPLACILLSLMCAVLGDADQDSDTDEERSLYDLLVEEDQGDSAVRNRSNTTQGDDDSDSGDVKEDHGLPPERRVAASGF